MRREQAKTGAKWKSGKLEEEIEMDSRFALSHALGVPGTQPLSRTLSGRRLTIGCEGPVLPVPAQGSRLWVASHQSSWPRSVDVWRPSPTRSSRRLHAPI